LNFIEASAWVLNLHWFFEIWPYKSVEGVGNVQDYLAQCNVCNDEIFPFSSLQYKYSFHYCMFEKNQEYVNMLNEDKYYQENLTGWKSIMLKVFI